MNQFSLQKWSIRIGIVLTGLIIGYLIQPASLQKYVGKLLNGTNQFLADGQRIEYIDIDNDGFSEEFIYYHLSDNRHPVVNQYSNDGFFQNAWYLDGEVIENFDFISGDYDNDSIVEVFVFSYYKKGLYLYGLEPGLSNLFDFEKILIHQFDSNIDFTHVVIHSGGVVDLNSDGFGEIIFSINSKFTPTPRRVFAYDIVNKNLLKSPEFGLQLVGSPILFDINNDGSPEIFLTTLKSTNQAWIPTKLEALNSSTIVLNADLSYSFNPVLFNSRMSVTASFPVVGDTENYIGSISWPLHKKENARLILLNKSGNILQQKECDKGSYVFDPKREDWSKILLFNRSGNILDINNKLEIKDKTSLKADVNQVAFIDIDGDKIQEFVAVQNNQLAIYRNNLSSPVLISIPGLNIQKVYFSVKKSGKGENQLLIQNSNQQYLVSYSKNRFYWFYYLFYLISICVVFLVYHLLHKLHLGVVEKIKHENEKFYLIQMELIRNQLDPHFLFNALNSISFLIHSDDRKAAYSNLGLFSKFLRGSIGSLDEFSRPLKEELDYVENYLILEKFRFKEKFNYDFVVGPGVNKEIIVPKLILFSFIESALKKGVLPKDKGGRIEITIDTIDGKYVSMIILDNGLHRNSEGNESSQTKNMLLMKRIVLYFNQFNINRIDISMTDNGTADNPKGSRVEITIPSDYMYIV